VPEETLARNGLADLVPRPDPTALTTEQLRRELGALREIIEARLDAMDKATVLLDEQRGGELKHLREFHDEKFRSVDRTLQERDDGIDTRFSERDTRSEREARDNKIAVDAAFAAAKEAVAENNKSSALANDKSEAAFTKQIDAILLLIDSKAKASDDKIDDIKTRLDRGEGDRVGQRVAQVDYRVDRSDRTQSFQAWMAIGALVLVAIIGYLASHFH
jgi:hypothetical protein